MSRAETTAMLSKLVEKRLKNRVSFWASEVNFDLGTSKNRRIDFMGFKPFTPGYVLMPASVELGEFSCYEVKSCMADFKSGHGLTFYGDVNYLVTTRELAEELRVNYLLPHNINQVLTPSKKRRQARTAFRRVRQVPILQVPRRKRNAVRDDRSERKEDKLSIADDEAEKVYPTRYWSGTRVKEQFSCDTDDLQEAYLRGRNAPPADAEVEAVARKLMWWDMAPAWEDVMPSEDCFWTLAEPEMRANYIRDAREMLEIARKAANE